MSSTLANFGKVGERILQALPDMVRNFDTVSGAAVTGKKSGAPYFLGTFRAGAASKLAKVKLRACEDFGSLLDFDSRRQNGVIRSVEDSIDSGA